MQKSQHFTVRRASCVGRNAGAASVSLLPGVTIGDGTVVKGAQPCFKSLPANMVAEVNPTW